MTNILHVNAGNMYGGIETFLMMFARRKRADSGITHSFAISFPGRFEDELRRENVNVHLLPPVRSRYPWTIAKSRRAFSALLRDAGVSAVVTHGSWNHAIFAGEAKALGIPVIHWIHGLPDNPGWLERWASLTKPDLLVINSHYMEPSATRLFRNVRHSVVYCPVEPFYRNTARRSSVRTAFSVPPEEAVIIQVSRFEPYKGHLLHIDALGLLRDLPGWRCWFVGGAQNKKEEDYQQALLQKTKELGIADRVRFLGQRDDVGDLLSAADIFCQPNRDPEPFGIVFVEALFAGLPVVTMALGGAREIVTPQCGRLIPPGAVEALAATLRELILSPPLRRTLGETGPERAKELCDPAAQLAKIDRLLQEACLGNGAMEERHVEQL